MNIKVNTFCSLLCSYEHKSEHHLFTFMFIWTHQVNMLSSLLCSYEHWKCTINVQISWEVNINPVNPAVGVVLCGVTDRNMFIFNVHMNMKVNKNVQCVCVHMNMKVNKFCSLLCSHEHKSEQILFIFMFIWTQKWTKFVHFCVHFLFMWTCKWTCVCSVFVHLNQLWTWFLCYVHVNMKVHMGLFSMPIWLWYFTLCKWGWFLARMLRWPQQGKGQSPNNQGQAKSKAKPQQPRASKAKGDLPLRQLTSGATKSSRHTHTHSRSFSFCAGLWVLVCFSNVFFVLAHPSQAMPKFPLVKLVLFPRSCCASVHMAPLNFL